MGALVHCDLWRLVHWYDMLRIIPQGCRRDTNSLSDALLDDCRWQQGFLFGFVVMYIISSFFPQKGSKSDSNKSKKIFVGGIPHNCGEPELRDYFNRFGVVSPCIEKCVVLHSGPFINHRLECLLHWLYPMTETAHRKVTGKRASAKCHHIEMKTDNTLSSWIYELTITVFVCAPNVANVFLCSIQGHRGGNDLWCRETKATR